MKVLLIILAVFVFIFLLTFIPVKIKATFSKAFFLEIRWLFLKMIFPSETEEELETEKPKKEKKAEKDEVSQWKRLLKKEGFHGFMEIVKAAGKLLGDTAIRILKRVKMKHFLLKMTVAGEDAAQAAILYGQTCAVLYPITSLLFTYVRCKRKKISVNVDYKAEENQVDFAMVLSIRPIFVIAAGIRALIKAIPLVRRVKS